MHLQQISLRRKDLYETDASIRWSLSPKVFDIGGNNLWTSVQILDGNNCRHLPPSSKDPFNNKILTVRITGSSPCLGLAAERISKLYI